MKGCVFVLHLRILAETSIQCDLRINIQDATQLTPYCITREHEVGRIVCD